MSTQESNIGMKQAPRAWYTRIDCYFTGLGFTKIEADANLYQIVGLCLVILIKTS